MKRFFLLIFFFLPGFHGLLIAQEEPTGTLESPYQTIYHHLYWLQHNHYDPLRAAEALWPGGDSLQRVERAIQLKQIMDGRGLFVRMERLPRDPEYLDSITQIARYVPFPFDLPDIFLVKEEGKWRYSSSTWDLIPRVHREVFPLGADWLVDLFGQYAHQEFLGLDRWQWGGLLGLPVVLFLVFWSIYFLLLPLMRRLIRRFGFYKPDEMRALRHFDRYFSLWILSRLALVAIPLLQLPPGLNGWMLIGVRIAGWIMVLMLGLRFLELLFGYLTRMAESRGSGTDNQILPIVKKLSQFVLWVLVLVPVLRLLDVNLAALIAGLSIGGLALALAAQDTVKNLISTLLILADHPYRVGDYIKAAGVEGTVVEIGFRSTRMMTIDSSIITIPNSNMINDQIVNLGVRRFRLVHFMIGLMYATPPERIEAFIAGLREMALAHPDTLKDQVLIYLHELNASSIDIRFRVPVEVFDIRNDYSVREELVFGIIRMARVVGVQFAFPSQSVYLEQWPAGGQPDMQPEAPAQGGDQAEAIDRDAHPRELVAALLADWTARRNLAEG